MACNLLALWLAEYKTNEGRDTMTNLKVRVFKDGAGDPSTTVTVPAGRPSLLDAIMGITRYRFGNASLATTPENFVRFTVETGGAGSDVRYRLAGSPPESAERVLHSPDSELFEVEEAAS